MIESSSAKNPLALIIEDNEAVAGIFKIAIERAEFEVEHIGDGRTALERLAVVTPTLILLDLHLPRVSGPELLAQIRADGRLAKTRVMLATADPLMAEPLRAQADLVLIKPISFHQMRDLAKRLRPPDITG